MKWSVIIPAAGVGKRMGAGINKQLLEIKGQTITAITLKQFVACEWVKEIILVISPDDQATMQALVEPFSQGIPLKLVFGGKERKDSVNQGIQAVSDHMTHVLVHDGARPFVTKALLTKIADSLKTHSFVVPLVASKDTLKSLEGDLVIATLDRSNIFRVQTPQAMTFEVAKALKGHSFQSEATFTDEASIAEDLGIEVWAVEGSEFNIKLTTPEDLILGDAIYTYLKGEGACE